MPGGNSRAMPEISPELADGVVGVVGGLPALFAHDANADAGRLDHGDIVGPIPDRQHADTHSRLVLQQEQQRCQGPPQPRPLPLNPPHCSPLQSRPVSDPSSFKVDSDDERAEYPVSKPPGTRGSVGHRVGRFWIALLSQTALSTCARLPPI